jgi:hypothetical protein
VLLEAEDKIVLLVVHCEKISGAKQGITSQNYFMRQIGLRKTII